MRYPNYKPYDENGNAWCGKCKTYKPPSEFPNSRFANSKHASSVRCAACNREYAPRYKDKRKRYSWRLLYGIEEADYAELFERQHGVCAICGKPETHIARGTVASLTVDHDHKTGRVRSLLCSDCNTAIGLLKDDPELLEKAAAYLRKRELPTYE